ncbi:ABC transporter ATP-binding protein [Eisenibacter elegans]|jgi:ABC-type multidrug transport system ATPase subunit|uniref:ABC transporter ATP-binding protein n=1 Tax=Eisenibacter elegans TaxID=997 RepID=UPI000425BBD5|nr:ABC transporter ATP-binding protein [Eisenibacter elegans]
MQIKLEQVGKQYGQDWVLHGIDLSLDSADTFYAFTGANGSGKSTLMQLLAGWQTPSAGKIRYYDAAGTLIPEEQWYRHLSYVAPYMSLVEELSLAEHLRFQQRFRPMRPGFDQGAFLVQTGLKKSFHKAIKHFSSGMKQRVKLALAIYADTPLVFLDEPTSNLDQEGIEWYKNLILDNSQGRLFVIASNQAYEYSFCEQVFPLNGQRS